MSKTIDKKGLKGEMGYHTNALKTIGKTDFEGEGHPPVHINVRQPISASE